MNIQQQQQQQIAAKSSNNEMSEWMAKKVLQQSEKQIDLIMNRINLLKKEEEKTFKRIDETKRKTDKVIEQKRSNQEINQLVNLPHHHFIFLPYNNLYLPSLPPISPYIPRNTAASRTMVNT